MKSTYVRGIARAYLMSISFWYGIALLMGWQYGVFNRQKLWASLLDLVVKAAAHAFVFALWTPPIFFLVSKYLRYSKNRIRYVLLWALGAVPFLLLVTGVQSLLIPDYNGAPARFTVRYLHSWLEMIRNAFADEIFIYIAVVVCSLLDFAYGTVSAGGLTFPGQTTPSAGGDSLTQVYTKNGDVRIGFYSLGLYFQDEYRVSPNLKLTLAIRGDRNSNPICASNCFSRLNTPFTSLTHDVNTPYSAIIDAGTHSTFPNVEKVALQPRFGFTWSPLGHSSTVLRGGVGVFSDLYQGILMDQLIQNSPLTNIFTIKPATGAPLAPGVTGSVSQLGANSNASFLNAFSSAGTLASISASNSFFTPPGYTSIANQINNPKYLEWNFEVQQAIGSKMSLNVNYVGTHGYDNLIQNANLNAANISGLIGTYTPFGQLPVGTETSSGVILAGTDPRFGSVRELQSVGISNYDGLVTTFTRRFSHGFQGSINYTYAHALDDLTTTNPGTPFNASQSVVYQVNPNCLRCGNYSNSDSDARHNITANYVWEMPFKPQSRFLNELVGGWSLAGTFYAHSGLPYTPQGIQGGS